MNDCWIVVDEKSKLIIALKKKLKMGSSAEAHICSLNYE